MSKPQYNDFVGFELAMTLIGVVALTIVIFALPTFSDVAEKAKHRRKRWLLIVGAVVAIQAIFIIAAAFHSRPGD